MDYLLAFGRAGSARLYGITEKQIDRYWAPRLREAGRPPFPAERGLAGPLQPVRLSAETVARIEDANRDGRLVLGLLALSKRSRAEGRFRPPAVSRPRRGLHARHYPPENVRRLAFLSQVGELIRTVYDQPHRKAHPSEPGYVKVAIIVAIRAMGGDPIGHWYHTVRTT